MTDPSADAADAAPFDLRRHLAREVPVVERALRRVLRRWEDRFDAGLLEERLQPGKDFLGEGDIRGDCGSRENREEEQEAYPGTATPACDGGSGGDSHGWGTGRRMGFT